MPCAEVLRQISEASQIVVDRLIVSTGFPPAPVLLEPPERPIGELLAHMDTIMVKDSAISVLGGQAGGPGAAGVPPKPRKPQAKKGTQSTSTTPAHSGVTTLSDVGSSGGGQSGSKKRAMASADAGKPPRGKRRAVGALQLGSKEGISESLVAAVSRNKGDAADPALAFFKAAAGSALLHHQEEVLANERFKAALAGTFEMTQGTGAYRADGTATECIVRFKTGRMFKEETFELLSVPELRGVVQAVLDQFSAEAEASSLHLLKPFKMAHVSPRVFWNIVHHFGGDVSQGLRQLVPAQEWVFLDEREKRPSEKARSNERQAATEREEKASRERKRSAVRARVSATASFADTSAAATDAPPVEGAHAEEAPGEKGHSVAQAVSNSVQEAEEAEEVE
eukprot:CAMPEP_0119358648 /NCGR_PEP_ID=MMETSP1334-20130426/6807_1 /TAXON_ID=127549 /ORGANISM="Calcidiscus leptoporus, Strain RCC1130" /LENGTH=394 /DNA_ID=CAMNT_0007373189 /DNA_START=83 /DNA_END=1264 /DNA_ORIENTATION=-